MELYGFPDLDYAALEKMWGLAGYAPWPETVPVHQRLVTEQVGPEGGVMPSLAVVGGGEQGGKHLHVDTPIATIDGWKRMGDLTVGDFVFDEMGAPALVEWVSAIQQQPSYRLIFDNGDAIIASASHLWLTQNYNARKHKYAPKIRTTRELFDGGVTRRAPHNHRLFANWSIDAPLPIRCPERVLPVPPYVLGAWLGDGGTASATLTCGYQDGAILRAIELTGVSVREMRSTNVGSGLYTLGSIGKTQADRNASLQAKLRAAGLIGNKHIPQMYLRASVEQRLQLLRGLMDTDGYIDTRGRMSFCNTNRSLIEGFIELVTSFGWSHVIQEKTARLYGKDCGLVWNVSFQTTERAFNLARKADRQLPEKHSIRSKRIYITGIEDVGVQTVRCIGVSADSHLYLAGRGMVPTHNSFSAGNHAFSRWHADKLVWIVGQRYEDCEAEYQTVRDAALRTPFHKKSSSGNHPDAWELEYVNGNRVKVLSSEDVTKIAREAPDGIIMAEAGRQSYEAFRALWRRAAQKSAWFLVSGTFENDPERWYADLWTQCQGDNPYRGKSYSLPTWANRSRFPGGRNDPKYRELLRSIMETNPMEGEEEIAERFEGRPRQPRGMVFSEFRTDLHVRDFAEYQPGLPVILFADPGWFPSSYAVLFCQKVGRQIRQFDEIYVQHTTNREVITMVKQHESFPDVAKVVLDRASKQHGNAVDSAFDAWVEELSPRGIIVTDAGYVRELDGRSRLHDKLLLDVSMGAPGYVVNPRNKMTIWEFQRGYRLRQRNDGSFGSDEPIDKNNHAIKALIYGMMAEFGTVEVRHAMPKPTVETMGYERAFAARRNAYSGNGRG